MGLLLVLSVTLNSVKNSFIFCLHLNFFKCIKAPERAVRAFGIALAAYELIPFWKGFENAEIEK